MNIILLIILFLMFLASIAFQIRDWIYISKYQQPINPNIECNYYYKKLLDNGFTIAECKNKYYCKKYIKNNEQCPLKCYGKKYLGTADNFEIMSSTDAWFVVKRLILSIGTILGMILTVINVVEKLKI